MKTINFCGDSFCATKRREHSWPIYLANLLDYEILGYGRNGAAYEHAIQTFDPSADATVFCWTDPDRLYHPTHQVNFATVEKTLTNKRNQAAYAYYKYLSDLQYNLERHQRDMYWFDNVRLKYYKGKIVHLFCYESAFYPFEHGTLSRTPLHTIAIYDNNISANHLTREHNIKLANYLYEILK